MAEGEQVVLSKRTLRERIAEILRKQILQADIKPGERINEEELAKKFQVSRGPVREALRQIEEEGLVTYIPHKGCIVKMQTPEEMSEAYLIRSTLEGLAVKVYSGKMSSEGLAKMEESVVELREKAIEKDLYGIITADEKFHEAIVEEAGCKRLLRMWKSLEGANTSTYHTMKSQGMMPYEVLEANHRFIMELFEQQKDADTIVQAISEHYMVVPETLYKATNKEERTDITTKEER